MAEMQAAAAASGQDTERLVWAVSFGVRRRILKNTAAAPRSARSPNYRMLQFAPTAAKPSKAAVKATCKFSRDGSLILRNNFRILRSSCAAHVHVSIARFHTVSRAIRSASRDWSIRRSYVITLAEPLAGPVHEPTRPRRCFGNKKSRTTVTDINSEVASEFSSCSMPHSDAREFGAHGSHQRLACSSS